MGLALHVREQTLHSLFLRLPSPTLGVRPAARVLAVVVSRHRAPPSPQRQQRSFVQNEAPLRRLDSEKASLQSLTHAHPSGRTILQRRSAGLRNRRRRARQGTAGAWVCSLLLLLLLLRGRKGGLCGGALLRLLRDSQGNLPVVLLLFGLLQWVTHKAVTCNSLGKPPCNTVSLRCLALRQYSSRMAPICSSSHSHHYVVFQTAASNTA